MNSTAFDWPLEINEAEWLKRITPGIDKAVLCQEKRKWKLGAKLNEMRAAYLTSSPTPEDLTAKGEANFVISKIASIVDSSIIVLAVRFEEAQKTVSSTEWPPTNLDALDCARKNVGKSYQYIAENLGPPGTTVDAEYDYESMKETLRTAFSYGLQRKLLESIAAPAIQAVPVGLARQELQAFLTKAIELAVKYMLPFVAKFVAAVESVFEASYENIRGNIEMEFDSDLDSFFQRGIYGNGLTVNSAEELDNICMNLAYKYNGYVTLPDAEKITEYCMRQEIDESKGWDLATFKLWFDQKLRYRNKILDD